MNLLHHTDAVNTGRLLSRVLPWLRELRKQGAWIRPHLLFDYLLRGVVEVPVATFFGIYTVLLFSNCTYIKGDGRTARSGSSTA